MRAFLRRRARGFDDLRDDLRRAVGGKVRGRGRQRDGGSGWRQERDALTGDRQASDGRQKGNEEPATCYHLDANHITSMMLRGQHDQQPGYAMVALLMAMTVMAIMLTMAVPTWKQMSQREKEAELVFRGEQYARAIGLFQAKAGPGTLPPSIDLLVEQRFLRKKFKDPITNDDFAPLLQVAATAPGQAGRAAGGRAAGRCPATGWRRSAARHGRRATGNDAGRSRVGRDHGGHEQEQGAIDPPLQRP